MRQLRTIMILIALLSLAGLACAGPGAEKAARPRSTADVVTAKVLPAELAAKAGEEVEFQVHLAIADTWHLYDHQYAVDPESFFIGVDLMPAEEANLAGFGAVFPAGEQGEFMGEKVVMLHHEAVIEVSVTLPADASGTARIPFVLTAQACDDKICLQPSEIAVVANVTVE
jgi:hypothetical protein